MTGRSYATGMRFVVPKSGASLRRKLETAARLPFSTVLLAGLAWWLLWPARAAIILIPLRRLAPIYGLDRGADTTIPTVSAVQVARARMLRTALAIAVRYSPAFANCYPQALTARLLLWSARVPHALFFGLDRSSGHNGLRAHAWIMVGPVAVCGGNSFDHHTVVRCFVADFAAR